MIVVAEVPSIEMEAINGRRLTGTSSSSEKSVIFQELTQSIVSSLFLDNKNKLLSFLKTEPATVQGTLKFTINSTLTLKYSLIHQFYTELPNSKTKISNSQYTRPISTIKLTNNHTESSFHFTCLQHCYKLEH